MSHEAHFGLYSCQLEFVKLEVPLPTFVEERTFILFKARVDLCGGFSCFVFSIYGSLSLSLRDEAYLEFLISSCEVLFRCY